MTTDDYQLGLVPLSLLAEGFYVVMRRLRRVVSSGGALSLSTNIAIVRIYPEQLRHDA